MKYENQHYYEAPRMFWVVGYSKKYDPQLKKNVYTAHENDKYLPFSKLSVNAKWLYQTLKELEHRYTGKKNDAYTAIFEGVDNRKGWFYCGMEKLSFLSGLSESTIRRARTELESVGILKTCNVRLIDRNGKRTSIRVTGYRVYGETEIIIGHSVK